MWTYNASGQLWLATNGSQRKQLTSEVAAWLYCAERNGEEYPRKRAGENGQDYRSRLHAWVFDRLIEESEPIEPEPETPEPIVDPSLLLGGSKAAVAAINDAAPSPDEAIALIGLERERKRVRKTVIEALQAWAAQ